MELKLKIPTVPNFILTSDRKAFSIADFTEEELRAIGKEWIEQLVKNAAAKRK